MTTTRRNNLQIIGETIVEKTKQQIIQSKDSFTFNSIMNHNKRAEEGKKILMKKITNNL